jgi:hypothetical protein
MKRLSLAVFFVGACSSSVAQDGVVLPAAVPQTVVEAVQALPPVVVEPVATPEPRKVVRTSRLEYEWLTKVCVSEGSFNIEECQKLLQTLENMRDMRADKSLLAAMFAQSAKITRQEAFTDTRQIWVSYLRMKGDAPPEKGWIECTGYAPGTKHPIPEGCTGTWSATVKQWVAFRDQVHKLYWSGIVPNVLPGKPIQWGGDMDYWRGVARAFCPLNVGGPMRNTYWADPRDPANAGKCLPIDNERLMKSKVISASIATGRAKRHHIIPQLLGEDSLIPRQQQEADL